MKLIGLIKRLQIPEIEVHCADCGEPLEIGAVLDSHQKIVVKVEPCEHCSWPKTDVF